MKTIYTKYWFEFEIDHPFSYPPGLGLGCGVTALDFSDAYNLIKTKLFTNTPMPEMKSYIENVDIRNLDQAHVIPNMKSPKERGIWFPLT